MTSDKDFLEYVVKSIVDHPEDVKIERKIDEMGVLLSLKVNPMDMGQVVGRSGSTAKAIRSLLRIVGIKNNARVNLKIEEPEGGARRQQQYQNQNNSNAPLNNNNNNSDSVSM
ncbi:MAG: KH domain-containing protein [Patescibacteria group bacterium]|nr:KH domain-containing protein [Patescibacteria group bacterium]